MTNCDVFHYFIVILTRVVSWICHYVVEILPLSRMGLGQDDFFVLSFWPSSMSWLWKNLFNTNSQRLSCREIRQNFVASHLACFHSIWVLVVSKNSKVAGGKFTLRTGEVRSEPRHWNFVTTWFVMWFKLIHKIEMRFLRRFAPLNDILSRCFVR